MANGKRHWLDRDAGSGTSIPIPPPLIATGDQEEAVQGFSPFCRSMSSSPSEEEEARALMDVLTDLSQVYTYRRNPQWLRSRAVLCNIEPLFKYEPLVLECETQLVKPELVQDHLTRQLLHELVDALLDEPIQDGVTHHSESILRDALNKSPKTVHAWIADNWENETNAGILASLMKCIGRLSWDEVLVWGLDATQASLQHSDIEVRDAAVQAIELWNSPEAIQLLRGHEEGVDWLRDYIAQILSD
jgi:hypothetical protein